MGLSIINLPFWGSPIYGNHQIACTKPVHGPIQGLCLALSHVQPSNKGALRTAGKPDSPVLGVVHQIQQVIPLFRRWGRRCRHLREAVRRVLEFFGLGWCLHRQAKRFMSPTPMEVDGNNTKHSSHEKLTDPKLDAQKILAQLCSY